MTVLKEEIEIYESMQDILELKHFGKWVLIHDSKLKGVYDCFEDAGSEASEKFGKGPYLIRRVGHTPITLPASIHLRRVPII